MTERLNRHDARRKAEFDLNFGKEVAEAPGGENLYECIQCGACSGACPMSAYMDHTPREIIGMIRSGMKEDVLRSETVWLCASCYSCTVICPRQIKITDLMYSLRQRALKDNTYPKRIPLPVMARDFYKMVHRHGRTNEGRLMTNVYLHTNPFDLIRQTPLALKLWRHGRMHLRQESVEKPSELRDLMQSVK